MRKLLICIVLASLGGCASTRIGKCSALAGPGWEALNQPPPNAAQLLALENLPADSQLVWLSRGREQLLVCDYARGTTSPGCGGSTAYTFAQKDGHWTSRGQINDFCDNGPS
jgi:hypothetical protein